MSLISVGQTIEVTYVGGFDENNEAHETLDYSFIGGPGAASGPFQWIEAGKFIAIKPADMSKWAELFSDANASYKVVA